MINIVYFSPTPTAASGGVKVIYRHAKLINSTMANCRVSASVFHYERPSAKSHWYEEQVPLKADGLLISSRDFVVLPECHLCDFWRKFLGEGIQYGIFVQGPYLIGAGLSSLEVREAFRNAALIMVISDDSQQFVCQLFPEVIEKIVPLRWSINEGIFYPSLTKSSKICFMPRRLPDHARLVCDLVQPRLPPDWRLVALHAMTESQVAVELRDSKIFMSFCYLEGLALPPVEAALSGNRVVGYHGQGGLEYWDPALFREVSCGDIQGFARAVLEEVEGIEGRSTGNTSCTDESQATARELLRQRFSPEREVELLNRFVKRVAEVMGYSSVPLQ